MPIEHLPSIHYLTQSSPATLKGSHSYHTHFTEEETEGQRRKAAGSGLEPRLTSLCRSAPSDGQPLSGDELSPVPSALCGTTHKQPCSGPRGLEGCAQ